MILTASNNRRRMSLTPMIDVVFLLLVFFMLAARFGIEGTIELTLAGTSQSYEGPPRLVDIHPDELRLNGVPVALDSLAPRLADLTEDSSDMVILRAKDGAEVQRLVELMEHLNKAGFDGLVLVE